MATVKLYIKNGLKKGPPVTLATFKQKLSNGEPGQKYYYVVLGTDPERGSGTERNQYEVFLATGAQGTVRIQDDNGGNNGEFTMQTFGAFEFWL